MSADGPGVWLLALLAVWWVMLAGAGWAALLRPRGGFAERLGTSYLLGLAVLVAVMLGWQLAGQRYAVIPLQVITALLGLAPLVALRRPWARSSVIQRQSADVLGGRGGGFLARMSSPRAGWEPAPPASGDARALALGSAGVGMLELVCGLCLAAIIILNLALAIYQPTLRWDELSHHMLAAKIFFHEGGVTRESGPLTQDVRTYPPFVPLTRTWLYLWLGTDNPQPNHLVAWAMFVSFLAVFHARLRDFVGSATALLFTLIAALLLFWGGTESLIDFPLITYGGLGVITAAAALRTRDVRLATLAGVMLGIAGLVRPDGLSFGLMNLGLFGVFALVMTRSLLGAWLLLAATLGLLLAFAPWVAFKTWFFGAALSGETYLGGGFGEMVFAALRSGTIDAGALSRILAFVVPIYNNQYGYVLLLALILLPLGIPDRRPDAFLCAALALNAAVYLTALYAFLLAGRTDLALREETAVRFGTRLLPLLIFVIGASPLVNDAVERTLALGVRASRLRVSS